MVYKKQFSSPAEGIEHIELYLSILKAYEMDFAYVKAGGPPDEPYPYTLKDWRDRKDPSVYYCFFYKTPRDKKDSSRISIKKVEEMYEFEIGLNPSFEDSEELCACLSENGWTECGFHIPWRDIVR